MLSKGVLIHRLAFVVIHHGDLNEAVESHIFNFVTQKCLLDR